jgi:hypothetical protein
MPAWDEIKDDGWTEMVPGGKTTCSRGNPFVFFVKKGDPKKIVLEFMGGGACWSELTCGLSAPTFSESAESMRTYFRKSTSKVETSKVAGETENVIFAGTRDRNSIYDSFTHVYVPYCTGDLHWGDAEVAYTPSVTIHHRGAINAGAAVDWMKQNVPGKPETVLVTGCSAGAYASLYWAGKIIPHYEPLGTRVVQFGDAGAGVLAGDFLQTAFAQWNSAANFPWDSMSVAMQGNKTNAVLQERLTSTTTTPLRPFVALSFLSHSFCIRYFAGLCRTCTTSSREPARCTPSHSTHRATTTTRPSFTSPWKNTKAEGTSHPLLPTTPHP